MSVKYFMICFCKMSLFSIAILIVIGFHWLIFWALIIAGALYGGNYLLNKLHSQSYKNANDEQSTTNIAPHVPVNITKYVDDQCAYIDSLSGAQFETYMVNLLQKLGFHNLEHTQLTHDKGLDAVGYNDKNQKVGFQFKHYQSCVGYDAVAQTIAGGQYYNTDINYIISTDGFTPDARNNAKVINHNYPSDNLQLFDRADLRHLISLSVG